MSDSGRILRRRRKAHYKLANSLVDSDFQVEELDEAPSSRSEFKSPSSDSFEQKGSKQKRRKIRRTQDFQNINATPGDINNEHRIAATKVKKSKKTAYLPKICDVTEEYDLLRDKLMNKKRKHATVFLNTDPESDTDKKKHLKSDTSVASPSGEEADNHVKMFKPKKAKRRNRRKKVVKFSETDETISTMETSESNTTRGSYNESKRRKYSDAGNRSYQTNQSTSDSDSVVYTFREGKQDVAIKNNKQDMSLSPAEKYEKSEEDSVEYNFKSRQNKKCYQMEVNDDKVQQKSMKNEGKTSTENMHSEVTSTVDSSYECVEDNIQLKKSKPSRKRNNTIATDMKSSEDESCMKSSMNIHTQNDNSITLRKEIISNFSENDSNIQETPSTQNSNFISQNTDNDMNEKTIISSDRNLPKLTSRKSEVKDLSGKIEKRRDTYELDKTVNDESVLKSFVVENTECSTASSENKLSTNLNDIESASLRQSSQSRKTYEFDEKLSALRKSVSEFYTPSCESANWKKNKDSLSMKKHILRRTDSTTPFSKVTRRRKVVTAANESCIIKKVSTLPSDDTKLIDDISPPDEICLLQSSDDSSSDQHVRKLNEITNCKSTKSVPKYNDSIRTPVRIEKQNESQPIEKMTSFGVSSTPLPRREGTYTLLKEQSINKNISHKHTSARKQSIEKNSFSSKKPMTRTKMPNFSLIHQKAYEKMENLEEFQQRKAERAKLLLSGAKPALGNTPRKRSPENKKILKQLNFGISDKVCGTSDKNGTPKPICLSRTASVGFVNILPSKMSTPKFNVKPLFDINVNQATEKQTVSKPTFKETNMKPLISEETNMKDLASTKTNVKPFIGGRNTKTCSITEKPNILKPSVKSNIPLISGGYTRYGFKTNASKVITKQEQLKAVANKNKILKNKIEERRDAIQGVRTNRRFELLMKMRNKS